MRNPRPFVVLKDGVYLFTVHAYTRAQAEDVVAARLADTTGVTVREQAR
jgi:hypothetical protein